MKKKSLLFTLCLLASVLISAAPRYWVGPLNGNWNNSDYWATTSGGTGGAGIPGTADSVIFNVNALVNIDISPTVNSLRITSGRIVTLYTSIPTIFTVTKSLFIDNVSVTNNVTTLKDSTSADVPFNFVFNGATGATASIYGNWVFEGGVPVSSGNGPTFNAPLNSRVTLESEQPNIRAGRIVYKNNTADISSNPSTLYFGHGATFILENNPTGAIPNATWAQYIPPPRFGQSRPASTVLISGNLMGELRHLASVPLYGALVADLFALTADASLALTHGTRFNGDLRILNTNNHTLTLLAGTGTSDSVNIGVGPLLTSISSASTGYGDLSIGGNNTKVTLARATASAPATSYKLHLNGSFYQYGGNFSLQDFNNATGSSTLSIRSDLIQTGGNFFTNSTATGPDTKFIVEMDDPLSIQDRFGTIQSLSIIRMSGGTIDNGRGMVTLRLNHSVYYQAFNQSAQNGVTLESPLTVGRLDLFRGPLNTTATNISMINDPNIATAVQIGTTGTSYVNGPLRRWTNSTDAYIFPTGKGNTSPASFVFDSCVVIPTTAEPSLYQAEYFKTRYADTLNVRPPLRGVSIAKYWDISKISGAGARIKLTLNGRVLLTTRNDVLVVAHYVNGEWVSEQGSLLIPADTTTGSVVSKPLADLSPFTFGYYASTNIPQLEVKCPSNIIVNTDPNSCNALVQFKAEAGENSTVAYKAGSSIITSPYIFPTGTTTVEVTASDNISTASCSFTVTVNDAQAPVITDVSANPATLSPADNQLKNVYINYTVTDNCGPVITTLSVTSNHPQTGNDVDWEIIDDHNVRLRAGQSGEDRVYTITITSTDESGNQVVKTLIITVPKTTVTEKIKLDLKVMPNPSKTYFTLYVRSNSDKPATLQVFDLFGRVKEVRRFYPAATIMLGDNYRPGVYSVKITQGNAEVYTALLKLPG